MEKFTTILSENYQLEEQMRELVKTLVLEESDIKLFEFNGGEFRISFRPKTTDVDSLLPITNQIKDVVGFPITQINIDKDNFKITLKRS